MGAPTPHDVGVGAAPPSFLNKDFKVDGGCSSAWLEYKIVDLVAAGSNPVTHPRYDPNTKLNGSRK